MGNRDETPTEEATLRDAFASHALTGIGTWMPSYGPVGREWDLSSKEALAARAEWAYAQADAMMAARNK